MRLSTKPLSFLALLAFSCLLAVQGGLASGQEAPGPSKDFLTFFIASDLHYLSPRLGLQGEGYGDALPSQGEKATPYIDEILDAFVEEIIAEQPDVVLLTGDLTFQGERASHEDLAQKLARIDPGVTRVYVIPGDRDIGNGYAGGFEGAQAAPAAPVTAEEFAEIYADFGLSLIRQDKDFSLDYVVESPVGPWILMLDTSLHGEGSAPGEPVLGGKVDENLFPWIKGMGQKAKEAGHPLITVTHHNLYRHHPRLTGDYVLQNNTKFFEWIYPLGVKLHFSGHTRIQDIVTYEGVSEITSQALCLYPHQYGVLRYEGGTLEYNTRRLNLARWAKAKGSDDPNLLQYDAYARSWLDAALGDDVGALIDPEKYTDQQRMDMLALVYEVNYQYYCGGDVDEAAVKEREAYKLLMQNGGDLAAYLQSIVADDRVDDTHLVVTP